jgi:hypothetical protein
LRNLSSRPELIVDSTRGRIVGGPAGLSQLGIDGPLMGFRLLSALPLNKSARTLLAPALVLADGDGCLLADPDRNVLGESNAVWVHRMLSATNTNWPRR